MFSLNVLKNKIKKIISVIKGIKNINLFFMDILNLVKNDIVYHCRNEIFLYSDQGHLTNMKLL